MTTTRKLFLFVVSSVVIYCFLSLLAYLSNFTWTPFQRVNLISDIVVNSNQYDSLGRDTSLLTNPVVIEARPDREFDLYHRAKFITNFSTDTSRPSLEGFLQKLYDLKSGRKRKIRIGYFGDSMIEGDLLTQTLRKLLQQTFGGNGVGFVPITSQVSKFRQTVTDNYSTGWQEENFRTDGNSRLYISGHLFRGNGDWVQMIDQTIHDSTAVIEKSLLCGSTSTAVNLTVNGGAMTIQPQNLFNRIIIAKDGRREIRMSVPDPQLPVYGISFESDSGVFVDNFSFRGITGIEFARIDTSFFKSVAENNPYDLIIFQYGVNLLFRPNDKNYNWYARALLPVVNKFKHCFPNTEFLLISTADRAFRYGGEYRSAIGIDSLVKVQATLAYETGSSFYNQFETMGGTNSIVDWAARNPSLANRDYVHPNHRGAEVLANYFYEALMNEYYKYVRKLNAKPANK